MPAVLNLDLYLQTTDIYSMTINQNIESVKRPSETDKSTATTTAL
jgi:hypothetical protein